MTPPWQNAWYKLWSSREVSGNIVLRFGVAHIKFGQDPQIKPRAQQVTPECRKNIEMERCTLEFVRSIAVGKRITTAGDFGDYLEVGLDQRFNLGLHEAGFHLFSTENPIEDHRL